ncbi:MAG TPA: alpha/beta fold hydrolase [Planctomycetota bacterium]|jgi:pimeloyl-ACP methyl ester carboxylesterase|nr:alpha/beta fold hydrolase [Planctomycetota bacterium]
MFDDIRNAAGEHLDTAYHPGQGDSDLLVVLGHGVTGNKDRPFLLALASGLEAAGVAVLRVSFAGNGDSQGRFEEATVTKEVADLGAVLDALGGRRVVFCGHSMAGAVGVLAAGADERIRYLVSLAGMVETHAFAKRKFGHLTAGKDNMWDQPQCPLSAQFMADMEEIGSVLGHGEQVLAPWLLVHGTADEVVPIDDSLAIHECAGGPVELVRLEGADHVFGGPACGEMVAAVVEWVVRIAAPA